MGIKIKDKDTDYKLNWIEEASMFVSEAIQIEIPEEKIIEKLQKEFEIPEDMLSLILSAGKILAKDEQTDYCGE